MNFFEKDGKVYKSVPAGGTGGGVTSYATVPATEAEAAAYRAEHPEQKAPAEEAAPPALKEDGPTIAEWVAQGYSAGKYPPEGYAPKSTPEEIAAAVEAEIESDKAKGADKGAAK